MYLKNTIEKLILKNLLYLILTSLEIASAKKFPISVCFFLLMFRKTLVSPMTLLSGIKMAYVPTFVLLSDLF